MIQKKRIHNIDNYLIGISNNEEFYIGIPVNEINDGLLEKIGFVLPMEVGMQVLPSIVGPVSRFNVNGGFIKHKDKPKETCYREGVVKDWHGNYHYVDIPYQRYQRTVIEPPATEIKVVEHNNEMLIVSPLLKRIPEEEKSIKHVINLFLEIFGHCSVLKKNLAPSLEEIPTKKVNWHILPKGEYPWTKTQSLLNEYTQGRGPRKKLLMEHRVKTIAEYRPTSIIIGNGGFKGYWIFEFADKGIYVLESLYYGDATYVMGNNWERVSQMTKGEILNNDLHKNRLIHRLGWEKGIDKILTE
ncbi:MAG: hypothetical protein E6767_14820 [Dysgonomonas sp.]|nr:hypothetical protein [Dysgonomonas sp.]